MALGPEEIQAGRRVSIALAKEHLKAKPDAFVIWRPEPDLPEERQYAIVIE